MLKEGLASWVRIAAREFMCIHLTALSVPVIGISGVLAITIFCISPIRNWRSGAPWPQSTWVNLGKVIKIDIRT